MSSTIRITSNYTQSILVQMASAMAVLIGVTVWQWDLFREIYIDNQVNAVGWVINGGIGILFLSGLAQLVTRFFEYRYQEAALNKFLVNLRKNDEPLKGIERQCMIAERYITLFRLNRQQARINHNALAATLHAVESSRNSYLKFVQSVLVLTGVFGTIVSLSIALLGASSIIQGGLQGSQGAGGMSTMIYGMSTALSTTMSAILAYLIFGYFYIKLTDTQTYLISRVEEVTATTLLPHLESAQDKVTMDYSESIRGATEIMRHFDQSQRAYADSAEQLQSSIQQWVESNPPDKLDENAQTSRQMLEQLRDISERQKEMAQRSDQALNEMVHLLREGFRLAGK